MSSPFQKGFIEKSPIDKKLVGKQNRLPEELKAKILAAPEDSPLNDNHTEDPIEIIGEQTFKFERDQPSGNFVAGLSLDDGSADPMHTSDRIVLTPKQKRQMKRKGVMNRSFIDQMEKMNIKKDSVSGGKNFYSIKK